MKKIINIFFLLIIPIWGYSQNEGNRCSKFYSNDSVDIKSIPDKYLNDLMPNYNKAMKLSKDCIVKENASSSSVWKLDINTKGEILDAYLNEGNYSKFCKDSLKVLFLEMGNWRPAQINGKAVCVSANMKWVLN